MELSALRIFKAVAQAGSVSRAAEQLNYVQPNVTLRIRQLEEELGSALFHRQPRGMRLTAAGRTLLRYTERIFAVAAEAEQALREEAEPQGSLAIGCTMAFAAHRLPPLLDAFHSAHPQVQVLPLTGTSGSLVEKVLAFELDGAFVNGGLDAPLLAQDHVLQEELVLVTARDAAPLEQMERRVALVFPQGCAFRVRLEYWLQQRGLAPYGVSELCSLEGILGCVAAGVGFTMLPRRVAEASIMVGRLKLHGLPETLGALPVVFIRRRERLESRTLNAFLGACLARTALEAGVGAA
jgi:DNA-binding transcriptional LysR family regulator